MKATLRRRFEMAERVRDFLRAQLSAGVEAVGSALTRLEELVDRAAALVAQQRAGAVAARGAVQQRARVRAELQSRLLHYLAGVAVVAAKENAQLAAEFKLPKGNGANLAFLTVAKGMLEKATVNKELLVAQGLSESVLADIATAIAEFEQTLDASRAARREHVGARGELEEVASDISEQVRLLEGLVRYRFGEDRELMTAWASARNVAGPFRSKGGVGPERPAGSAPGDVKAA
jgi:hypothetical protein